jgi:hypothetical protein
MIAEDGVLSLQGCAAPSSTPRQAQSLRTWFVVHDDIGPHYFVAQPRSRPDVAAALHRPELAMSGFNMSLDLSEINTPRSLEMLVEADGTASRCPIEIPIDTLPEQTALYGKSVQELNLTHCQGNVDVAATRPNDSHHMRISGWVFDATHRQVPTSAYIVSNDRVIGMGLTGIERPDVSTVIDKKAVRAGFEGYATSVDKNAMTVWCKK